MTKLSDVEGPSRKGSCIAKKLVPTRRSSLLSLGMAYSPLHLSQTSGLVCKRRGYAALMAAAALALYLIVTSSTRSSSTCELWSCDRPLTSSLSEAWAQLSLSLTMATVVSGE